jgi:hypothetical protein
LPKDDTTPPVMKTKRVMGSGVSARIAAETMAEMRPAAEI